MSRSERAHLKFKVCHISTVHPVFDIRIFNREGVTFPICRKGGNRNTFKFYTKRIILGGMNEN